MKTISYEEFEKVEIRSGKIVRAEPFDRARRPSFKIWVDFGPVLGILQTSAQVTIHYTIESLVGRYVMGCINLGEKNIAGFSSQFLLLGFPDEMGAIYLGGVDPHVPNGQKLY